MTFGLSWGGMLYPLQGLSGVACLMQFCNSLESGEYYD